MSNLERKALDALTRARVQLVLGRDAQAVFLAALVLRLEPGIQATGTASTNGRDLCVEPGWWLSLGEDERCGVLAHEVLHVALQHHTRREQRDPIIWNIAGDLAINSILRTAEFALPASGLLPGRSPFQDLPAGLSADEYFRMIEERCRRNFGTESSQNRETSAAEEESVRPDGGVPCVGPDGILRRILREEDPGGCGQVCDAARERAGIAASRREWEVHLREAEQAVRTQARSRGNTPAWIRTIINDMARSEVDWRAVLRHFISVRIKTDFSWLKPSRRSISTGVLLPGFDGESLGRIVVAIDTSGSVSKDDLSQFQAELRSVAETWSPEIRVVYHDTDVTHVDEWLPDDPPLELHPTRRGGTSHIPVLEWIDDHEPDAIATICLTDLETIFPEEAPVTPVLWVTTGATEAPFGEIVEIHPA